MHKDFEKILDPNTLKRNLTSISLFITAFEMLKQSIIDKPKTMYLSGFDRNELIYDKDYEKEVLGRNKSCLFASFSWLQEYEILDSKDYENFLKIKSHRNELAHEIVSYVTQNDKNLDIEIFQTLIKLIQKLERNWFVWFEAELQPEILNNDNSIAVEHIKSGTEILLDTMIILALDN